MRRGRPTATTRLCCPCRAWAEPAGAGHRRAGPGPAERSAVRAWGTAAQGGGRPGIAPAALVRTTIRAPRVPRAAAVSVAPEAAAAHRSRAVGDTTWELLDGRTGSDGPDHPDASNFGTWPGGVQANRRTSAPSVRCSVARVQPA